ncbi:hypothetical protein B0H34DRAFT_696268 [Crassisporium funariophilum]|nr:hypothetical protein B0H34DRAFT_696268 [Crassisporium funariophilum]
MAGMTEASFPPFPQDIYDRFMECFDGNRGSDLRILNNSSLVCRAWLPQSRKENFRRFRTSISATVEGGQDYSDAKLADMLGPSRPSPTFCPFVQHLRLYPETPASLIECMLQAFPNISSLAIFYGSLHIDVLNDIRQPLKGISTLSISRVKAKVSPEQFVDFICSFPSLERLSLGEMEFVRHANDKHSQEISPDLFISPRLHHLALFEDIPQSICLWLTSQVEALAIKTFSLEYKPYGDVWEYTPIWPAVPHILHSITSTLENLTLPAFHLPAIGDILTDIDSFPALQSLTLLNLIGTWSSYNIRSSARDPIPDDILALQVGENLRRLLSSISAPRLVLLTLDFRFRRETTFSIDDTLEIWRSLNEVSQGRVQNFPAITTTRCLLSTLHGKTKDVLGECIRGMLPGCAEVAFEQDFSVPFSPHME